MSGNRWAFAVLLLLSLVPDVSEACLFCGGRRRLFDRCGVSTPCGACCGPMITESPCFTPPPVQPCLVPQQFTTYRDVPQTCYRQEPVCVTVPVTTARQVTVDEGCYQKVWVPRLVTKTVPQTVYQQQMSYRTVPVTTMARVPVTETRMVPMMPACPPMSCAAPSCAVPSCATPFSGGAMFPPGDVLPGAAPAVPVPYGMPDLPGSLSVPTPSLPSTGLGTPAAMYNPPSGSAALAPVPTAQEPATSRTSAADDWSSVERRAAFFRQEFGESPFNNRVQPAAWIGR